MQKGVSAVIAVILLLLITISIIGMAFLFFVRTTQSTADSAESQLTNQQKMVATTISIDSAGENKVYVRNMGSVQIPNNTLAVYINGNKINYNLACPVDPNKVGELTFPTSFEIKTGGSMAMKISGGLTDKTTGVTIIPKSCKGVRDSGLSIGDGIYSITPVLTSVQVYCDMTRDGGGWTFAVRCNSTDTLPSSCWNTNAVGVVTDPNIADSVKLSDNDIRAILSSGENLTRGFWGQQTRNDGNLPAISAVLFNRFSNADAWSSDYNPINGKVFYYKYFAQAGTVSDFTALSAYVYARPWMGPITTQGDICSPAANGWSNGQANSCGETVWYAGCENGPSMSHNCANQVEKANLTIWLR